MLARASSNRPVVAAGVRMGLLADDTEIRLAQPAVRAMARRMRASDLCES